MHATPEQLVRSTGLQPGKAQPGTGASLAIPIASGIAGLIVLALGLDRALLAAVNAWPRSTGAAPWAALSILGEASVAIALAGLCVLRRPRALLGVLLAALITTLIVNGDKELFPTPRPTEVLAATSLSVIGPRLAQHSFPSGHAAVAFCTAFLGWTMVRSRWARAGLVGGAALVALSRLAIGVHWPVDVLAGAAFGWLSAGIGMHLAARWPLREDRRFQLVVALLPPCAAVRLIVSPHVEFGAGIDFLHQAIGVVMLVVGVLGWWRLAREHARSTQDGGRDRGGQRAPPPLAQG